MDRSRLLKSDGFRLSTLVGLCLALGTYLILTTALISHEGTAWIDLARSRSLAGAHGSPPGYPLLLRAAHKLAGSFTSDDSVLSWILTSQAVTLLCRVLALIPLYLLGKSLIGGARAFWAVLILILLPCPGRYGSDVSPQWPYLLFLSLGFYLLYWGLDSGRWWMLGLVGVDAAIGCLIHPLCGQLVIYGLVGLMILPHPAKGASAWRPLGANFLLVAGFAGVLVPYAYLAGAVPQPSSRPAPNSPPAIASIGGKPAGAEVPQFEVRAGEFLEIAVEASDPDGDKLTFSAVSVPPGSFPVYRFHSAVTGSDFWTISDQEKTWLLTKYPRQTWRYEGIAWYACAKRGDAAGLVPVHRFWSATQQRHFYTANQAEKDTIDKDSPNEPWTYEGVAFYAFAESGRPPAAVPVYRFWSERSGYSWAVGNLRRDAFPVPAEDAGIDAIAWYVYAATRPPAGLSLDGHTMRWRPGPDQTGDYTINVIAGDGELDSCIVVKIKVTEAQPTGSATERPAGAHEDAAEPVKMSGSYDRHAYASVGMAPGAGAVRDTSMTLGAGSVTAEGLMALLLVPWCLGLYHRLRHEAGPLERALMLTVVLVNAGLVLAVSGGIGSGPPVRYGFGLVALTIFYVPAGLDAMAQQLDRAAAAHGRPQASPNRRRLPWFPILAIFSVATCVPGLAKPVPAQERACRIASQWLRENTGADDVIAVADMRISFYAERRGLLYKKHYPDRRLAGYVVTTGDDAAAEVPPWLRERYSVSVGGQHPESVVIYETTGSGT
jgi:hypothetical protein